MPPRKRAAANATVTKPPAIVSDAQSAWSVLSLDGRKARYGMSYLRNVCAQAGLKLTEGEPDEDVLAVDATVDFAEADVRVQVKCTSTRKLGGSSLSWQVKPEWRTAWNACKVPVYLVVVIVPPKAANWLSHRDDGTWHATAAYWARVGSGMSEGSVKVPKDQRLTAASFATWHSDLTAVFTAGGAA